MFPPISIKTNNYLSLQVIDTKKKDHDICCWKSRSWIGRGTNLFYNKLRKVNQPAKKK